jgi:hypothetical protein
MYVRLTSGMNWLMTRSTCEPSNETSASINVRSSVCNGLNTCWLLGALQVTPVTYAVDWNPADCSVHYRWHLLLMQWTEFLLTTQFITGETCYLCSGLNSCWLLSSLQVTAVTYAVDWISADCSVHYRWHLLLMQWTEFLLTTQLITGDTCYLCSGLNFCWLLRACQVA